jgi:replicative superfamily II helicase
MGQSVLTATAYGQMKGRAGRKGKDTHGESFLCYLPAEEDDVMKFVRGEMPAIESRLGKESRGFERALLEAVAANLATSHNAVVTYASWTLYSHQVE